MQPAAASSCYHCGLPIPGDVHLSVRVGDVERAMCCAGCQAVAQAIVDNRLDDYYRHRDTLPQGKREALPAQLKDLGVFDHPEFQKNFVRPVGEHEREAALILEGITCAACVWLNEQHLTRQAGVTAVEINYATRRARVRWDERRIKLSAILEAIAAIGYNAYPFDVARSEQLARKERRDALWRVFVAGFGMMQVMMYALPMYIADPGTMTPDIEKLMRWASLLLTLPVILYSAAPFFTAAWRDLRIGRVGMDVPVALGVGSAFAASCWATFRSTGTIYFDSVAMFVFLLLGGRYFEMVARQRAVRGVEALSRAVPALAQRLAQWPARAVEQVAVNALQPGEHVLVEAGATLPADGVVVEGTSQTDESLLSGESTPVAKAPGDSVTGGAVNIASPLVVRVERVGEQTRLAAIVRLMERAAQEKPRLAQMADRVASRFVLALLVLAVLTAVVWLWLDSARALWIFVAVLVVSCPCALSLATPAALTSATGALSALGVLVTRAHAIETFARATHVAFDKTGTLTMGRMRLEGFDVFRGDPGRALALAAAMEHGSGHTIGRALEAYVPPAAVLPDLNALQGRPGQGMEASLAGVRVRIGRPSFVAELHGKPWPEPKSRGSGGQTLVALGDERGWIAAFRFADEIRPGARELVAELKAAGLKVSILSGDSPSTVHSLGEQLGVSEVHGGLTPDGKREWIEKLQGGGAVVAMVGDGINDAPVLAQAQVSIAMGSGTELARTQGDIVLLAESLTALGAGWHLARRTMRIIRQNLVWSFAYNFGAIPLAMAGWVTPWMAGLGMSASSALVVFNALRLQSARRAGAEAGQRK
ncbi:MAG: heavy metal translocating P-type ATPase [Rhodocyclaceae bacterium]|nr:heavy metal translocating P-type ATPase [Rhodocyclaceae bacterium]